MIRAARTESHRTLRDEFAAGLWDIATHQYEILADQEYDQGVIVLMVYLPSAVVMA
jgi:hypothetical protein